MIYIAGPQVFLPDRGSAYYKEVRELLQQHNVTALIPIENEVNGAMNIRAANMKMIDQCDAVIADLSPFRSHEPDCGTAFEVGYAVALKKMVLTVTKDKRSLVEKYGAATDAEGQSVEDFNLPFNLMLADGVPIFDNFADAFQYYLTHRDNKDKSSN